jgi:hypothetical protein
MTEDWRRWSELHEENAFRIARLFAASGRNGEQVLTSIDELGAATGCSDVDIRAGLEVLTQDEAATLRLVDGAIADPERLPAWAAFVAELHHDVFGPPALDR